MRPRSALPRYSTKQQLVKVPHNSRREKKRLTITPPIHLPIRLPVVLLPRLIPHAPQLLPLAIGGVGPVDLVPLPLRAGRDRPALLGVAEVELQQVPLQPAVGLREPGPRVHDRHVVDEGDVPLSPRQRDRVLRHDVLHGVHGGDLRLVHGRERGVALLAVEPGHREARVREHDVAGVGDVEHGPRYGWELGIILEPVVPLGV